MFGNRWKLALGIALGGCLMAGSAARAQQAGFVLFPDAPNLSLNQVAHSDVTAETAEQAFVHPVTGPYFHEDSLVSTDLRAWYAYHEFSPKSAVGGGEVQVLAAQIRVAITPQLQLVAYKDGFSFLHTGGVGKTDGWNDLAAGLKYEFLQDYKNQLFAAAGLGYQLPWGESKVLQNKEELRAWLSVNKGFDKLHLGGTFNYFWATGEKGVAGASDHLSAHAHADYYVCKMFSPVLEANWYHVVKDRNAALPIQGADYTNLGGSTHDDILTAALGAEVRPTENVAVRAAYEKNLLHRNDIFDSRITVSAVFTF